MSSPRSVLFRSRPKTGALPLLAGFALTGLVLSGCTSGTDSAAGDPATASTTASGSSAPTDSAANQACSTEDLTVTLGERTQQGGAGQYVVPLTYQNSSDTDCTISEVPMVTLVGPDDPNGPQYELDSSDNSGNAPVPLAAGASAVLDITVLTPEAGGSGSNGSTSWTPTQLVTSVPGDTATASVDWPSDLPVLRQDTATRQGTYIGALTPADS